MIMLEFNDHAENIKSCSMNCGLEFNDHADSNALERFENCGNDSHVVNAHGNEAVGFIKCSAELMDEDNSNFLGNNTFIGTGPLSRLEVAQPPASHTSLNGENNACLDLVETRISLMRVCLETLMRHACFILETREEDASISKHATSSRVFPLSGNFFFAGTNGGYYLPGGSFLEFSPTKCYHFVSTHFNILSLSSSEISFPPSSVAVLRPLSNNASGSSYAASATGPGTKDKRIKLVTPPTSSLNSSAGAWPCEAMVEAVKKFNNQNEVAGQVDNSSWRTQFPSQQNHIHRNGFSGMFGTGSSARATLQHS